MKILYIANFRMPTEKAHGIQVAKMCESFGAKAEVILVLPKRANHIKGDICSFYNVEENFKVVYLPSIDLVGKIPRIGFWIQSYTFARSVKKYLKVQNYKGLVYSRDQFAIWALRKIKDIELVYEIHNYPKKLKNFHKQIFDKIKFVSISQGLKRKLIKDGVQEKNIFVAPDAVDIKAFDNIQKNKDEIRKELSLPLDKKIVMYTGHLYSWKGSDILLEATKDIKAEVFFIGGLDQDIINFREKAKELNISNVHIWSRKAHKYIPLYLKAADVLVLPNSGQSDISKYYTSPLKLFEYMASGVPVVASDLPSIRDIVDEDMVVFAKPDNPVSLAEQINKVLKDDNLSSKLSQNCLNKIKSFTWEKRVNQIIDFLKNA